MAAQISDGLMAEKHIFGAKFPLNTVCLERGLEGLRVPVHEA